MPTVEVYDQQGNVVETYEVEEPSDAPPTQDERIASLEAKLAEVRQRLDNAPTASDLDELKSQLGGRK